MTTIPSCLPTTLQFLRLPLKPWFIYGSYLQYKRLPDRCPSNTPNITLPDCLYNILSESDSNDQDPVNADEMLTLAQDILSSENVSSTAESLLSNLITSLAPCAPLVPAVRLSSDIAIDLEHRDQFYRRFGDSVISSVFAGPYRITNSCTGY